LKVLVWQWGRRGAGPRYAAELARSFRQVPDTNARLSLSASAELLRTREPPECALPVATYSGLASFTGRVLTAPVLVPELARWIRRERVDVALCAMPAALDLAMAAALRWTGTPYAVVVHEADLHPGDRFASQIRLQRWLLGGAEAVFALSTHVAERLRARRLVTGKRLLLASLPPFHYGTELPRPGAHGGALRLLSFGRLLPYKGLDLLADALTLLGSRSGLKVRVVGSGPESADLDRLRALPGVVVENRWVQEDEISDLLGWADALILSHREASQSGVAAAAIAARRWVIATRVGGLAEQLGDERMAVLCDPEGASVADAISFLLAADRTPPIPDDTADAVWSEVTRTMVAGLREIAGLVVPA
jgi:glycosyltransferase involved in cell wall biosynthesis